MVTVHLPWANHSFKASLSLEFGKLSSGHRTRKGQFSFQSQRRAMPMNVQTTVQLHLFHMLIRLCSKSFKLGFSNTWTKNFQLYWSKLDLGKNRGTRHKIAKNHWIIEKAREFQKNIYFCFIGYMKAFDCVHHSKLWIIFKETGISGHLTCILRSLCAGQEAS